MITFIVLGVTTCFYIQSHYTERTRIQALTDRLEALEQEYTILQQELHRKEVYHQSSEKKLSEWNNCATSSPQPHETIYQILDIAATTTVTCTQVKQHQSIIHTHYTEIPATFHLHGSFEQILLFFDHLETVTTIALQEVSLQVARDLFMLNVMMKVHTTTLHSINVGNEFYHPFLT